MKYQEIASSRTGVDRHVFVVGRKTLRLREKSHVRLYAAVYRTLDSCTRLLINIYGRESL